MKTNETRPYYKNKIVFEAFFFFLFFNKISREFSEKKKKKKNLHICFPLEKIY
jgi:hypothetical protein